MPSEEATPKNTPYGVLKLPEFRAYLGFRFLTTLAMQIQAVAVAWQVYSVTKDALSLGLIGLSEIIPAIGCALFAGHVVDRSDRRQVLWLATAVTTLLHAFLWALSRGMFPLAGSAAVHAIYASVFVGGVARAFYSPAQFAFFAQIVPRDSYVRASSWSSTCWQVAAAAGPALGGLIYGFCGVTTAYASSLGLMACGLGLLLLIRRRGKPTTTTREPFVQSLTVGLRFVFRNPLVLSALSIDMFAVLFGGAVALLPIFADILHVGPQGLGLMRAAPSIGAFSMAFFLAHRPPGPKAGPILLGAISGFGLCMVAFALSRSFVLSLFVLALSGAFDNVSVIVRSTLLQLLTPDEMRGRVQAVNSIFIGSSNEIGEFESGVTARWMGTVPSVIFGGVMTLVVVATTAWLSPQLRRLNLNRVGEVKLD